MKKNQPKGSIAVKTEKSRKATGILKQDKQTGNKSAKVVVADKSITNNKPPKSDASSNDNEALNDLIRFIVGWFPISLVLILLVLSPIYLFSMWFFDLFLDDINAIFNLTTGLFGILGGISGWRWKNKKSWVAMVVGVIAGIGISIGYFLLSVSFISY